MAALNVQLLGAFRLHLAAVPEVRVASRKARALLAYLAASPGRRHERPQLAALLWGNSADAEARHSLRQALSALRRLAPDAVIAGDLVGLASEGAWVDAVEFERAARANDAASLERAASLYVGDLLHGFQVDAEPFDEWLRAERERLRELALDALARLLALHTRAGALAEAVRVALRSLEIDPFHEPIHRALIHLYVRQGRRAAALNHYQRLVELLRRELGAEPELETRELYQRLLQQATPASSGDGATTDETAGRALMHPPLVGRDAEIATLRALADGARRGKGRTVLLGAEAGAGKSRLLDEITRYWLDGGGRVLFARCHEIQRSVPFSAWSAALADGLTPADLDRLLGRATLVRARVARLLPESDVARADPEAATRANRDALVDAVLATLAGLARESPLLVALDDVQWADASSLELVGRIARALTGRALLLVVTARDEQIVDAPALELLIRDLSREGLLRRLAVDALSRDHVYRLARSVAGGAPAPASHVERICEHAWRISEGNALLAIEAALDATARRPSRSAAPDAVRALVAARLVRLTPAARRMADVAAILGREFEFSVIARASGLKRKDAAGVVEELVRRRVIRSAGGRLEFAHDLIREAVASELADRSAVALHRNVARALAARGARDAAATAKQLAYHYGKAGLRAKAVDWLTAYADRSLRICVPDEAVLAIEQALAHVETFPARRRAPVRLDLLLQLATALALTGQYGEILRRLLPEEQTVEALSDPVLAARYALRVSLTQIVCESRDGVIERIQRGLRAAEQADDAAARARLLYAMAADCYTDGTLELGVGHAREAVELLERVGDQRWLALALWILGVHHLIRGELDAALDAELRSSHAGLAADDAGVASFGATTAALVLLERGDLAAAEIRCRDVLGGVSEPINTASALGVLGLVHAERGELDRAISLLEPAVAQSPVLSRRELFAAPLAEAYVAAGDIARAKEVAAWLREASKASASPWRRGRLRRVDLQIAALDDPQARVDDPVAQAIAELRSVPAPLEAARTHRVAARIATKQGDRAKACEHLGRARALYAGAGATLRVAEVEQLLGALGL